ncbi:MAG: hypothetical protein FJ399_04040 [Verrucomicrobia bacterium]|nr:hypothetical protein [Verrucomicrobiota bacterium]
MNRASTLRGCGAGTLLVVLGALRAATAPAVDLGAVFADPPASTKPWVYWYWINGNISKEGIRADLADMKRVGIGGAFIMDGSIYLPPGPVRYGTDAWHAHVQHAITVGAELGVEIGIMNCAGWATSGGPWNDLDRSMKQLGWSDPRARSSGRIAFATWRHFTAADPLVDSGLLGPVRLIGTE